MADGLTVAGALLVGGPLLGLAPVAYPPLLSVWSASREEHIRIIAGHRRAWSLLNAGLFLATIATAAGLAALAGAVTGDAARAGALIAGSVVYAMAGGLWCAVVAIRMRATPALHDLGAADGPPEPAERMLSAATGGLFAAFILATGGALIWLGVTLALTGGIAAPVAWVTALVGAVEIGVQLATGDTIPAVLYLPTMLIGLALLVGWT